MANFFSKIPARQWKTINRKLFKQNAVDLSVI